MKFKAQIKAGTLLDWLRAIHAVTDECILIASELDVVEVRAVDPANVVMIVMRIPDHAWDLLEVAAGHLIIDVERLIEVVEMFDSDADLTIVSEERTLDGRGTRTWLTISDGSDTFWLEMPDPTHMRKPPVDPEIGELSALFIVDAALLQQKVRRAELVDDKLLIAVDADGSVHTQTATDHDYYRATLPKGELEKVEISGHGVRSIFAIDYLQEIMMVMSGRVLVQLGQDKAVQLSCTLHGASVMYTQAPRIEGSIVIQNMMSRPHLRQVAIQGKERGKGHG